MFANRYCCNVGSVHVQRAIDSSLSVDTDRCLHQWVLSSDPVLLARAVAVAVGREKLQQLATHFQVREEWFPAAKTSWAVASTVDKFKDGGSTIKAALALVRKVRSQTMEVQQLEIGGCPDLYDVK